ncbi:MAG: hypothetical protein LBE10_09395 [Treponema sp.]|jgi:hypothetical protein|nr:hypothetical protein [Treponema sp.]
MKYVRLMILLLPVLLVTLACKSAPTASEEPPAESLTTPSQTITQPDQASLSALDQSVADLERLRQFAIDIEGPSWFPDQWDTAEAQYNEAKSKTRRDTPEQVKAAAAANNTAAASFQSLIDQSLPLYAQVREDQIISVREDALAAGIGDLAPDYLLMADKTVLEAQTKYEDKDYYGAIASAFQAVDMYEALVDGCTAYYVRQEIEDRDFIRYDPENFDRADEAGLSAIADYEAMDPESAKEKAEEARLRYNLVLNTGWQSYAAEKGAASADKRQEALKLKANVAVRSDFEAASRIFDQGNSAFKAEDYPAAADFFVDAESRFITIRGIAEQKRQAAENAIRKADEKMVESEANAEKAEAILGGGSL